MVLLLPEPRFPPLMLVVGSMSRGSEQKFKLHSSISVVRQQESRRGPVHQGLNYVYESLRVRLQPPPSKISHVDTQGSLGDSAAVRTNCTKTTLVCALVLAGVQELFNTSRTFSARDCGTACVDPHQARHSFRQLRLNPAKLGNSKHKMLN